MKQVLIKNGSAVVEDVPAPHVEAGAVLVEVEYSCISVGTEMSGLRSRCLFTTQGNNQSHKQPRPGSFQYF